MKRIRLSARPRTQKMVAWGVLAPNYSVPPGVRIEVEGYERLPDEPVIFAMNHTDRFNYWPFQYHLYRNQRRFTATWVKGKYYESALVGKFMELTNNIPTVSRGYLITKDFSATLGRRPSDEEYRVLRDRVDAVAGGRDPGPRPDLPGTEGLFERARGILGRDFDPSTERWEEAIVELFRAMMRRFVELNVEAFDLGLDLLVFPEGTRSVRLQRGRIGLAQIALKYRRTIVPVGANGCDRCYPGAAPFARPGHIVYRIGDPIRWESLAAFHIDEDYEPFTAAAETAHRDRFQGAVDVVMSRIDELLDERHKHLRDAETAVKGSHRFI